MTFDILRDSCCVHERRDTTSTPAVVQEAKRQAKEADKTTKRAQKAKSFLMFVVSQETRLFS
jgi:hypothetical protein